MSDPECVSAADVLADDIEQAERDDPQALYAGKLPTIRWMQDNGTSDAAIERLLGVRLRDEHRRR